MLTRENNARLCQVGPDTPMGDLLRRFWIPALLSSELPEGRRDPVRVKLLGENFVAFRDAAGKVGFLDEYCPHRGASLALGRCEADGIRCIYHGWKFSVDGSLLETPNFRSNETFRKQVKAITFPCVEAVGILWVYLGPADRKPPFPTFPFTDESPDTFAVARIEIPANWVQIMEGHHDSSHASYLHQDFALFGADVPEEQLSVLRGNADFVSDDLTPKIEIEDTAFGFYEGSLRKAVVDGMDGSYARIHAFAMPFLSLVPPKNYIWEVPMDDHNTSTFALSYDPDGLDKEAFDDLFINEPGRYMDESRKFQPTPENRWFQDRTVMDRSFSGISSIFVEDVAVCASMGPIIDRTKEHLVSSDIAVGHMRRRLLEAASDLEKGIEPSSAQADLSTVVPIDALITTDTPWQSLLPTQAREEERA